MSESAYLKEHLYSLVSSMKRKGDEGSEFVESKMNDVDDLDSIYVVSLPYRSPGVPTGTVKDLIDELPSGELGIIKIEQPGVPRPLNSPVMSLRNSLVRLSSLAGVGLAVRTRAPYIFYWKT